MLATTEMANGFANRFLWFCVQRSKMLPDGGSLSDTDFQPLLTTLRRALRSVQEGPMHRDAEAAAAWRAVYPTLSESKPGLAGAILARGEAQVLRLSMLYALLDSSMEIRAPHLLAALAVWEYVEDSVAYIFGTTTGHTHADTLADALQGATEGTMTKREILKEVFHGHIKAHELNEAIRLLVERGTVTREFAPSKGGRRAEQIRYGQSGEQNAQSPLHARTRYVDLANEAMTSFRMTTTPGGAEGVGCEQREQSEQSPYKRVHTGTAQDANYCEQREQSEQSAAEPCLHEHVDTTGCCNDCGLLLTNEDEVIV